MACNIDSVMMTINNNLEALDENKLRNHFYEDEAWKESLFALITTYNWIIDDNKSMAWTLRIKWTKIASKPFHIDSEHDDNNALIWAY